MPTGPKGQKRPADVIGNAVKVMRIATGEEQEDFPADDGKDKGGAELRPAGREGSGQDLEQAASNGDCQGRRRQALEVRVASQFEFSGASFRTNAAIT